MRPSTNPRFCLSQTLLQVMIIAFLIGSCWSATWIIVRKDGQRIECSGPFVIINGVYTFRTADGKDGTLLGSEVNAEQTAAANTGRTTTVPAARQSAPTLAVPATAETAYADAIRLQGLLHYRRFQELTSELEQRQAAFQQDIRLEAAVTDSFDLLVLRRPGVEPILDEWVRQSPKSWVPFVARGFYFYGQGWETRGTKFANQTTDARFASMARYFERASLDLESALQLNPRLVVAYQELIGMAKAGGKTGDGSRQYLQRALDICPACFEVRRQYMVEFEPRWGGSYEEMQEFAAKSQHADNPQLRSLFGSSYWDNGNIAQNAKRFPEAIQLYTKALSFGEYWAFYYGRGGAAVRAKRYKEALPDLNRAIELRPTKGDPYIDRAVCWANLGDYKAAKRDLMTAHTLPSREEWLSYVDKWLLNYGGK